MALLSPLRIFGFAKPGKARLEKRTHAMTENETPIFPEAFAREMEADLGEAEADRLLAAKFRAMKG